MPAVRDLLNSFFSSAFNDAYKAFDPLPDTLPEKQVHSVPPNIAHGNAPLDDLYYWLIRESIRALARSLFGIELDATGVSPYTVSAGHAHDQNQDAAMCWNAPVCSSLWFDEGAVTIKGAAVIELAVETDVAWLPIDIPDGVELVYFRLRCGTAAVGDIGSVRVRLYSTAALNGSPVAGTAFVDVRSKDGASALSDQWVELSPISATGLTVSNSIRQGWARVSGLIGTLGQKMWVSEIQCGLREGA